MIVTRYESAESFLERAAPLLMLAEAENNLIIGVARGIAANPPAANNPYLATVAQDEALVACAAYLAPFKLIVTRAGRDAMSALAADAFAAVPDAAGVTGPARSASDFALAWSRLSGIEPTPGMRLRIYETRGVKTSEKPEPVGAFRRANGSDLELLTAWTDVFVAEARIPETVDAAAIVRDSIRRGRLHVWEDGGGPVSMAAWTGKTPNGVRINFVYTPLELRGRGYATACVSALTGQLLASGSSFCWLYTDVSNPRSSRLFTRIGYRAVSDVAEFQLR
jgi:uncharacterized protein